MGSRVVKTVALALGLLAAVARGAGPTSPAHTGTLPMQMWRLDEIGASAINWKVLVHPVTGFVYVANASGVLEFDGARWRLIPLPNGAQARTFALAPNGEVWVGGSAVVAVLRPDERGELHAVDIGVTLPPPPPPRAGLDEAPAAESGGSDANEAEAPADPRLIGSSPPAFSGPDGVYFSIRRRIVRFRPEGGFDIWRKPTDTVTTAGWWSDGSAYFYFSGAGAFQIKGAELKPAPLETKPYTFESLRLASGQWAWLTRTGPMRWDGVKERPQVSAAALKLFQGDRPWGAVGWPDGTSAFATTNHGVVLLDDAGAITQTIDQDRGLPGNRVNALARDAAGGLWLATHRGIVRVQLATPFATHGATQGFVGSPRLIARSGDRLYVAHSEGVSWRDDREGKFHAVAGFTTAVNQLADAGDQVIVAGVGAFWVPREGPAALLAPTATVATYGIYWWDDHHTDLLLGGTINIRWWQRDTATSAKWEEKGKLPSTVSGSRGFRADGHGFLWVSARDARIWRLDFRAGLRLDPPAEPYGPDKGLPKSVTVDRLRLLKIGPDIFVVSHYGVFRYDPAGDRFVVETRLEAGPGPSVGAETADGGWLYYPDPQPHLVHVQLGTDGKWRVTSRATPEAGSLEVIDLYADSPTQSLWLCGIGQLLSFDLTQPEQTFPAPRALLRRVTAGGETVWAPPPYAPATAATIALSPEHRGVRVEFAAPVYRTDSKGGARLLFRSRTSLVGNTWTLWTDEAHRDLTGLPDGLVTIDVQARDFAGRESAVAKLAFFVAPPWWRTDWAYAGYTLCAGLGIVGIVRVRTRGLRRKNERLEAIVADRTRELALANTAKSEFLENISHEIRNPLNGIVGVMSLMSDEQLPPRERDLSRSLKACVRSLEQVFEEILNFSKLEYGYISVDAKSFALAPLLDDLQRLFSVAAQAQGCYVTITLPPDFVDGFVGDEAKIKTIVGNFLGNAIKYASRAPVEIRVDAQADADGRATITIEVADHGAGIPEEEHELIFKKFVRGSATRENGVPGTGLGLAACRALAELMHGSVGVESPTTDRPVGEPGAGATFFLRLPLARGAVAAAPAAAALAPADHIRRALVVEDLDYNRAVLEAIVRELGYEVESATDLPPALTRLANASFELVLLDNELPTGKGTDLAREIRRRPGGDRPILIAITAQDSEEMRARCRAAGMDEFALKPIQREKLRELIRAVRARRGETAPPIPPPAAASPPAAETKLDLSAIQAFAPPGARDPVEDYLAAFDVELRVLHAAAAAGEAEAVARTAHRLCGHAGLVDARAFCELCDRLTRAARGAEDWPPLARELPPAAEALKQRVRAS
jgi:signal transduction histidine kinase/CheY-like chemotaxis protein